MKVYFAVIENPKDSRQAYLNSSIWNTISSAVETKENEYVHEYEASYYDVLNKLYRMHEGDAKSKWQKAHADMQNFYCKADFRILI